MRLSLLLLVAVAAAAASRVPSDENLVRGNDGMPIEGEARLFLAVQRDDATLLTELVTRGGETLAARDERSGATPLHVAAYIGALRVIEAVLFEAKTPSPDAPALLAARDLHGATPLHYAAVAGRLEAAKLLLRAGASCALTTRAGATPLYDAAREGRAKIVELLARRCPRSTASPPLVEKEAADGTRPLFVAALRGHEATVEVLLEAGAQVSAPQRTDEGKTALHACVEASSVSTCAVLLEYGASALERTLVGGHTPLHVAVHMNAHAVYERLRASRDGVAAEDARDAQGLRPLELAQKLGYVLT